MEYVNRWQTKQRHNNHHSVSLDHNYRNNGKIRVVAPYQYIVDLNSYVRGKNQTAQTVMLQIPAVLPGAFDRLTVTLDKESMLIIESNTGAKTVFDLRALVAWARDKRPTTVSADDMPRLTLAPVSGDMAAELRLSSFTVGTDKSSTTRHHRTATEGEAEKTAENPQEDSPWHMQNLSGTLLFSLPGTAE
jgi:hypothetical protein